MKHLLLIVLSVISGNLIYAQDVRCNVLLDSLKGTYAGECQNGKANGTGKAVGVDTYEGQFVDGYPEGKGMYIWKDGHYYIGQFKKGKLNGTGEMYYESAGGEDSLKSGYWKKNKYKGLYERPYIIHRSTNKILDINCRQMNKKENNITIEAFRVSSAGTNFRNSGVLLPYVKRVIVTEGSYSDSQSTHLANSASTILLKAVFPFRATIYLTGDDFFDISLLEKGEYEISVRCL